MQSNPVVFRAHPSEIEEELARVALAAECIASIELADYLRSGKRGRFDREQVSWPPGV